MSSWTSSGATSRRPARSSSTTSAAAAARWAAGWLRGCRSRSTGSSTTATRTCWRSPSPIPGRVTVEARRGDITRPAPDALAGADVVVASALLDMLTADELTRMLAACAGRPLLIAMTVTGRVSFAPPEPLDVPLGVAFNAHQRRDGRLGPDAVPAALDALGGEVLVRPSPWHLGAAHAELMTAGSAGGSTPPARRSPSWPPRRAPIASGGSRRRTRPPSTTPTCWCCRDDETMGAPRRRRDPRRARVARRDRPIPRRSPRGRRPRAGGRVGPRGADHGVLRVALADGRRRPRGRPPAAHGGRGLLPLALPQRHPARRGRGRRPPRDQPRPGIARRRPRAPRGGMGAIGRPGGADPAHHRRAAGPPSPVRAVAPLVAVAGSAWWSAPQRSSARDRPAPAGDPGGRGRAAPPAAIFVTPSSLAGRGRRSPSRRRSSSPAMPSRS